MASPDSVTPTQVLLLGEIVVTLIVFLGVRAIRRRLVHRHRLLMLSALLLNLVLLASFLVVDAIRTSNTIERGLTAPLWVFIPLLTIHLAIAITALTLGIVAWRIARQGIVRDANDRINDLLPDVRRRHRRVSRFYPSLWYSTLATGLLLYAALYMFPY